MSLHDRYARITPFEVAFPERAVIERLAEDVAQEAGAGGRDDSEPEAFLTLAAVGDAVRELRGPDAPADAAYPFAALLFHAVHFLRAGCPLYLVEAAAARRLTAEWGGAAGVAPRPPAPAGYLQLPQHLLWTGAAVVGAPRSSGGTPESVDGVFWMESRAGTLHALSVTGLRPERPGFGALPLPPAPLGDAAAWLDASMRAEGDDFASTLPGAELDRLYSVETAGEVLKLLARFFAMTAESQGGLETRTPTPVAEGDDPRPSVLPYTRVTLPG